MENKYLGSTGLAKFLENLYNVFSKVGHTHTKSQITDFPTIPSNVSQLTNDSGFVTADEVNSIISVDSTLSDTSTNPVQNKVIKEEFDVINSRIDEVSVSSEIYKQNDEPIGVEDGTLWLDLDAESEEDQSGGNAAHMDEIETLKLLSETGIIEPMTDRNGAIYTAADNTIYVF